MPGRMGIIERPLADIRLLDQATQIGRRIDSLKYDDASWHYGGDFPPNLPTSAGGTHIAMFVSWAVLNGMAGDLHMSVFSEDLEKLNRQEITPGEWFFNVCDGKFTSEDLNSNGQQFAETYYANENGLHTAAGLYLNDYDHAFSDSETLYHVPDTWGTWAVVSRFVEARLASWRNCS